MVRTLFKYTIYIVNLMLTEWHSRYLQNKSESSDINQICQKADKDKGNVTKMGSVSMFQQIAKKTSEQDNPYRDANTNNRAANNSLTLGRGVGEFISQKLSTHKCMYVSEWVRVRERRNERQSETHWLTSLTQRGGWEGERKVSSFMLQRKAPTNLLHKQRQSTMELRVKALEWMMRMSSHKDDNALENGKDTFTFLCQFTEIEFVTTRVFSNLEVKYVT